MVTADQIRRRGYKSLLQVLQDLPDYKVEKRSDPEWYTDFTVRGINGQDTFVILLDGMKITPSSNERIPIMENYPVHMAKQIEVVYGPASALYGADAVSGVINIISKDFKVQSALGAESTRATDGDHMRLANFHGSYEFKPGIRLTVGGQWFYDPLPELDKTWGEFNGFADQRVFKQLGDRGDRVRLAKFAFIMVVTAHASPSACTRFGPALSCHGPRQ